MKVINRNGESEDVRFDKITDRLIELCEKANISDQFCVRIAQQVTLQVKDGITTSRLDELTAGICASLVSDHPDYGTLAGYLVIDNLQKNIESLFDPFNGTKFVQAMHRLYNNQVNDKPAPLISGETVGIVDKYAEEWEKVLQSENDFDTTYFGFKTLERAYLLKDSNGIILETPQFMLLRVSIGIHGDNYNDIVNTYLLLSQQYFTHATPTLFNSGTISNQMSSCFLIGEVDDSVTGIFKMVADCAQISKYAGGIGLSLHNIRCQGSYIRGNGGRSDGIIPLARTLNSVGRYINQGGKRKGSIAVYMPAWHGDIMDFLEAKMPHGDEERRAKDLFYALWLSDEFMIRVEKDLDWYLMCPSECPDLAEAFGENFSGLYNHYVEQGKYREKIKAQDLWFKMYQSQAMTGSPYVLFKDSCHLKSNQQNLGPIYCSNLCAEVVQYSDTVETAVCNLASINLKKFVKKPTVWKDDVQNVEEWRDSRYDFVSLENVTKVIVRNLNQVIDRGFYPTPETKKSNTDHRPMGIGVQGLADTFLKLKFPFESTNASYFNNLIFETIYHAALSESLALSKEKGPYTTFNGSPLSQGLFQFDLWEKYGHGKGQISDRYNWDRLRHDIQRFGVRNSLLISPMPTASTSQILGSNECFEPFTSNVYTRKTLAGNFIVLNEYLVQDLISHNLWTPELKQELIEARGSVQNLDIPQDLKELYKTVYEIKQKALLDLAADRGHFVCQSQSLNIWMAEANYTKLTKILFYAWKRGLKTGMYYLRTKPQVNAVQFSVPTTAVCETCSS